MRPSLGAIVIIALLASAACAKKNDVDVSTDIITGVECTDVGDPACGKDGACVLDYCRQPCTADNECPKGALCIGTAELSGCQLTWDAYCNMSQPCKMGLTCVKQSCRMPCTASEDCPRADQECLQDACVGTSEPGAATDAGTD